MPAPTTPPVPWADDTLWSSGPRSGEVTKVTTPAGVAEQGVVGGLTYPTEYVNYAMHNHYEWLEWLRAEHALDIFGDGSDGDVTINAGTTTLSRDMYYDDLTITGTGVLETAGYRVFVRGTLAKASGGIIRNNGGAGGAGGAGVAGTAGAAAPGGSLGAGFAGGLGGNVGAGAVGTAATDALGGAGGAGGSSNDGGAGGAAGSSTAPVAARGGYRHLQAALGRLLDGTAIRGGAGGGGGGGGTSGTGGGGGGGGGVLVIIARIANLAGAGQVQALGGAGGAAYTGPDALGNGGGGGGGGGVIYLVARERIGSGTLSAAGGAGGADHLVGDVGAAGSVGRTFEMAA